MTADYLHLPALLSNEEAGSMLRLAENFGSFGTYADEASNDGLGEALPQRFDAAYNYVTRGIDGAGNPDNFEVAAQRTNYFRETYAYGDEIKAAGIEPFMNHPALKKTARRISGNEVIVPAIVYANILVPGQELAVHTDVPEFRGANRKALPQWLLVVMLHSGLFDEWRIPIVTCVSWFGTPSGGAFTFYPDGVEGPRRSIPAGHNSAIVIDTDTVFHGVERVGKPHADMPGIDKSTRLHFTGNDHWQLRRGDTVLANYAWPELRYSISWKAYCFRDSDEKSLWKQHGNDLTLDFILDRLDGELRHRNLLSGDRPEPTDYAMMLVDSFVRFPVAANG